MLAKLKGGNRVFILMRGFLITLYLLSSLSPTSLWLCSLSSQASPKEEDVVTTSCQHFMGCNAQGCHDVVVWHVVHLTAVKKRKEDRSIIIKWTVDQTGVWREELAFHKVGCLQYVYLFTVLVVSVISMGSFQCNF